MENLELPRISLVFFALFFLYIFPIEVNVLVKPCEMVTWPHVCYDDVILDEKLTPILNLVMNCTLIV